jgi:uncharacterized protein (UPF0297 family)
LSVAALPNATPATARFDANDNIRCPKRRTVALDVYNAMESRGFGGVS